MIFPDIEIGIIAEPKWLCALRAMVRGYAQALGYGERCIDEIVLAVDEAVTNAIRHSYGGPCNNRVQLLLGTDATHLKVCVRDDGVPAPAEKVKPKPIVHDPANPVPGGLGVQLIYRVFEEVEYRPGAERGNTLTMRLPLPLRKESETERHVAAD